MPQKPKKNQSQSSYMSSCVKELKAEGKSSEKAREICTAVWYSNKEKKK
jgi:hypothetical protein